MPHEGLITTAAGDARSTGSGVAARVLLVAQDHLTRDLLAEVLPSEGLEVEPLDDAVDAIDAARGGRFELVILELADSGCGLQHCRTIRSASDIPIVVVAARDSPADRVLGLEAGADDYIGKPFAVAEVISRIRAILRRRELDRGQRPIHRIGDIEIDLTGREVRVRGERVDLTPTEFRLLELLAREPGRPFTAREILRHLWGTQHVGPVTACRAHVFNLRRKLDPDPGRPRRIVTVRGVGYLLRP